jgi:hypothetical protein
MIENSPRNTWILDERDQLHPATALRYCRSGRARLPEQQTSPRKDSAETPADPPPANARPTLTKATVAGPTDLKEGGFRWAIQWILSEASPRGGCVVQGVSATWDIKDKDGNAVDPKSLSREPAKWEPAKWRYWEAWQIHKGMCITGGAQIGDVKDDIYAVTSDFDNTKGSITMLATT